MSVDPRRAEQLEAELLRRGVQPVVFDQRPSPLEGGFSAEVLGFEVTERIEGWGGCMVLRLLDANAGEREQIIQRGVASAGFPTARPILVGGSDSCFDQPYIIMERLDGAPAVELHGAAAVRAFRDVPALVANSMIALHRLDPQPIVAELHRRGIDEEQLGVDAAMADIDETTDPDSGSRHAAIVLQRTRPWSDHTAIVHGDLHALNLWRRTDGTVALLDWEMATIGPPELDVARSELMLTLVPGDLPPLARPLIMSIGRRTSRAFRTRYAREHRVDEAALNWYRALLALRLFALVCARPPDDAVASEWRPVRSHLAAIVETATGVPLTTR